MPGKTRNSRYRAMQEDVRRRAWYAFSSGVVENPYPVEDKRHDRFTRMLNQILRIDDDFEDLCDVYGSDTSKWTMRVHAHPGPVKPIEQLI